MPQPSKLMSYQKMRRKIGAYSGSFTTKLRNSLIKRNNISTGELINSIKSRLNVLSDSKKMITSFEVSFKGYGGFLNKNIHPKRMPSIDAIVKWMKDRNIKPYRTKSGRFASREQAAYRIARGIQKNGFSNFNPESSFYKGTVGWLDVIWEEEKIRLRKKARKDLLVGVQNMVQESLSFMRPTKSDGQSVNQTFF
tara:strand:+ start:5902 stop:6486 length:585 start_codon:yes stop_codon:yes gene_type:complete